MSFPGIHRFLRRAELLRRTCPHLDEYQAVLVPGHYVDFAVVTSCVALDNLVVMLLEELACEVLSPASYLGRLQTSPPAMRPTGLKLTR